MLHIDFILITRFIETIMPINKGSVATTNFAELQSEFERNFSKRVVWAVGLPFSVNGKRMVDLWEVLPNR